MRGMGSVITVSTRVRPGELARLTRSRADRDRVAQFAAEASKPRQLWLLRQIRDDLLADPDLDVFYGERTDGYSYLTVYPAGERTAAIWGEPNGAGNPESYWDEPETP
jgi:integrase